MASPGTGHFAVSGTERGEREPFPDVFRGTHAPLFTSKVRSI